jgi:hypothetical protein
MVVGAALAGTPASSRPAKRDLHSLTSRTPLLFEKNEGQTDARAALVARGDGYTVFVTPSEAVLKLQSHTPERRGPFVKPGHEHERSARTHTSVLRMALVNANPQAKVTGEHAQATHVSYLRGKGTQSGVATYAKARCEAVYPGVDLVYYGNQRQLEYDFVVAPGTDPDQIRFRMDGAKDVAVDADGHLAIRLEDGDVQLQKPLVYQDLDGQRQPVESSYRLAANGEVAFQLGDYDATRPLVIDPVIVYSTLLGGGGFDSGSAVTFGADGSIYVAGYTQSVDFPASAGQAPGGPGDAFVTKFTPDGAEVVYSAYLGGSGTDAAGGIGVDSAGRVIVSGYTDSSDFPVPGGFQTTLAGKTDAFVARLNSTGTVVEYGTYLGGVDSDGATRMTLDANEDIYVTGYTSSADFPTSQNAVQPAFRGDYDAFAVKIAKANGSLVFSTYIGGRDGDSGSGIQVDSEGSVYVGGSTDSGDFPVGTTLPRNPNDLFVALVDTFQGGRFGDAFITKLTPDGSDRIYSTYIGSSGSDSGADIAVDRDGFCYLTGTTDSFDLMLAEPVIQPFQSTRPGGVSDIYVTKIFPDGRSFRYMTYLGSVGEDVARALEVDEDLNPHTKAYVLGETSSPQFPLQDALQSNHGGNSDLFLTKLHEDMFLAQPAVVLDYSTFLGGSGLDHAGDLMVDAIGNAAITGDTISNDFPQHQGPGAKKKKKKAKHGSVQGFVAKVFDGVPEPGGVLDVTRRINFGNVKSGRTVTKKLNIRNISSSRLLAVSVETPLSPVSIGKGIQSVFIKPGGSFQVTVGITGTTGITNTALVIRSSDPARPVVNIPITAKTK